MNVPKISLQLETNRLILEPTEARHAAIMVDVLSNPELYRYIPFDPPVLEKLQEKYRRWEARISPQQDEIWLNWVARLKSEESYIGEFQVGYKDNREAYIAYMLAPAYQGKGYAIEALTEIISVLFDQLDIVTFKAWIDTRNEKSIQLVKRLGMNQIATLEKADHFKGQDSDEFVFELKAPVSTDM